MFLHHLKSTLTENDFGGKAYGLSRINSLGLLVPDGYAIDKKAQEELEKSKKYDEAKQGLENKIKERDALIFNMSCR